MDLTPHLDSLRRRFDSLIEELSAPDVAANPQRFQQLRREQSRLEPILADYARYERRLLEHKDLLLYKDGQDAELKAMAEEELVAVEADLSRLEHALRLALLPRDPNEDRNILLEIRAGTGGDEAAIFAADLLRMYQRFAEQNGWRLEVLEGNLSEHGGYKEVVALVAGASVWKHFKFERGVHRVQRVPVTEGSGRIHTSTATVAVLAEAEEVDLRIDPSELRIDTYRASGAGGQHVNKTESAIRITHIPTGFVVACQDERSQIKNRAKAMKLLRSRLLELMQAKQDREISQERRNQVGTGERSEKIRTYNFPQDRITDHRINVSLHNLPAVMEGAIGPLIKQLQLDDEVRRLAALSATFEKAS